MDQTCVHALKKAHSIFEFLSLLAFLPQNGFIIQDCDLHAFVLQTLQSQMTCRIIQGRKKGVKCDLFLEISRQKGGSRRGP